MLSTDQILGVLWRRRVSFALTFALILGAIAAATFLLPKVYSTSANVLISNKKAASSTFEATQVNQVQTKTISELMLTRGFANEVSKKLPFNMPGAALQGSVQISPVSQAQLIQITAEGASPQIAQTIANTYAQTYIDNPTRNGLSDVNVSLAAPAALIDGPVRPQPKLYLIIGALLAAFVAAGVALARQRFDQRLQIDPSDTEVLEMPIIGRIPQRSAAVMHSLGDTDGTRDTATRHLDEAFRLVMANLSFVSLGTRPATVAIVSSGEGEGKSTSSYALARAAAELGIRTLLIDADLRRPQLTKTIGASGRAGGAGLSAFLSNLSPLALGDVVVEISSSLHFMPAGPPPPNPSALLASKWLGDLNRRARRVYDFVIYDTPPLAVGADATLLAAAVEGVIMIVDPSKAKRSRVLQGVDQLKRAQANTLGVVLNRTAYDDDQYSYYSMDDDHPATAILDDPRDTPAAIVAPAEEPVAPHDGDRS